MSATAVRLTADERREEAIAAAAREFATNGYAGTSTQAVAERVGVSQPYLFQLFGTKKELFLAVVRDCYRRVAVAFEASVASEEAKTGESCDVLEAMGNAYIDMLTDRNMLRLQLQAYAACADPDIQVVVQDEWTKLYDSVAAASGATDEELHNWFAEGMLLTVAAAIGDMDSPIVQKLARGARSKR